MKKKSIFYFLLSIIIVLSIPLTTCNAANFNYPQDYTELKEQDDALLDKVWTITFNKEVQIDSSNAACISVYDDNNNKIAIKVTECDDLHSIAITPVQKYNYNSEYYIYIDKKLLSEDSKVLSKNIIIPFNTCSKDEEAKIKVSENLVHNAEGTISSEAVQEAEQAVNNLMEGVSKNMLSKRLNDLNELIDELASKNITDETKANIKNAVNAVNDAEASHKIVDVAKAESSTLILPESKLKQYLLDRINKIPTENGIEPPIYQDK
ncbi:Ig-like domain-containing protein [Clostridium hydrogenum]|uniref:Ig-like domain-containing protein n=1 Tax=Clostridium hydrogenum TaxID=2855764 RepID=UPI001F4085BB|nr:Ig-like domain-containing protein [Clostridium hydrogenum]